jgi:hypothetical protein
VEAVPNRETVASTPKPRYRTQNGVVYIDLRLRQISQLFDSRDPVPFLERDLDENAADYIVSATMEHPTATPIALTIHISDSKGCPVPSETVVNSIHNHFSYNADLMRKKIQRTLRQGRFSLLIGLVILLTCIIAARAFKADASHFLSTTLREGLVIIGWVAMWRPIDMFLYSWWPEAEQRRVFLKLSEAPVEILIQKM